MKTTGYLYEPHIKVMFSRDELILLTSVSRIHYDFLCRQAGLPGGFLYGLMNMMAIGATTIETVIRNRDLDLLCKILENDASEPARVLFREMHAAFAACSEEWKRLNPHGWGV